MSEMYRNETYQNVMETFRHFRLVVHDHGTSEDKKMLRRILLAMQSKDYRTAYDLFVVYFDQGMRGVMNDFHFPTYRYVFESDLETLILGKHLGQYFRSVADSGNSKDKEMMRRILLAMLYEDYRTAHDLFVGYFDRGGRGLQLDSNFSEYRSNIESLLQKKSTLRPPTASSAAELAVGGPLPSKIRTFVKREGLKRPRTVMEKRIKTPKI